MSRLLEDLLSLSELSHIHYITIETQKHPFNPAQFPTNPKLIFDSHFVDTRVKLKGALLALLRQESYNLTRFKNEGLVQKLQAELQKTSYDFVIFESLFAAVYAPILKPFSSAKFIYRAHNIEHQIWKDLARNSKNWFKKWYLHQLAYSLKWAERSIWSEDQGALDIILTISKTDLAQIENQTLTNCKYLPASAPKTTHQCNLETNKICFLGAFNWAPNIEAVDWFLQYVFPLVKKSHPALQFHIAGKDAEKMKHWQQEGVVLHGFVADPKEFIASHGIFVGCLQSGSGVKMKIIEAMSVGAPIVLSVKSADGLPDLPDERVVQSAQAFIEQLIILLQDKEEMVKCAQFFENYFLQYFQDKTVQKQLVHIIDELQNNR
jgi:glycosyltransferase involved in cell wall biosynthesis